jgi:hypothetical protein
LFGEPLEALKAKPTFQPRVYGIAKLYALMTVRYRDHFGLYAVSGSCSTGFRGVVWNDRRLRIQRRALSGPGE